MFSTQFSAFGVAFRTLTAIKNLNAKQRINRMTKATLRFSSAVCMCSKAFALSLHASNESNLCLMRRDWLHYCSHSRCLGGKMLSRSIFIFAFSLAPLMKRWWGNANENIWGNTLYFAIDCNHRMYYIFWMIQFGAPLFKKFRLMHEARNK